MVQLNKCSNLGFSLERLPGEPCSSRTRADTQHNSSHCFYGATATWADRSSVRNTATEAVSFLSLWKYDNTPVILFDGRTIHVIFTTKYRLLEGGTEILDRFSHWEISPENMNLYRNPICYMSMDKGTNYTQFYKPKVESPHFWRGHL